LIDTSLGTERTVEEIYSNTLFQKLKVAEEARFDAAIENPTIRRRGCTAKTREGVLGDLIKWAENPQSPKIYWMIGMAGTGKSTIAYTFCELLAKDERLGASFFCSRSLSECRDARSIFPTIAYQLARSCPPFARTLLEVLKKDLSAPIRQQFKQLILDPIKDAMSLITDDLIVIIDALDECIDNNIVRDLLQ